MENFIINRKLFFEIFLKILSEGETLEIKNLFKNYCDHLYLLKNPSEETMKDLFQIVYVHSFLIKKDTSLIFKLITQLVLSQKKEKK